MVLQNDRFASPQCTRNAFPFFAVKHHASKVVVDGMTLVESQRILRHHVERYAEDRVRFSGYAVRVTCGVDVWSGFMDLSRRSVGEP